MKLPNIPIPIQEIPLDKEVKLFIKREDLIHPEISGNKYWKLFYNIKKYLATMPEHPMLITFGGAFSNHIAATAALARDLGMASLGIIRGDELSDQWQNNETLCQASANGMRLEFVTRSDYRNKDVLTRKFQEQYPQALIIPEGGTNENAVQGIKYMLDERTRNFDYLCVAVGTGGTVAGLSKFSELHQNVLGFKVINDRVEERILKLSERENFKCFDASFGGYGKFSEDNILFINQIYRRCRLPLDPVYTGKMLQKLFELIENGYFEKGARILVFHTGGLQAIYGANSRLKKQNKPLIELNLE